MIILDYHFSLIVFLCYTYLEQLQEVLYFLPILYEYRFL